ncbi:MAG: hypothetical protein BWY91_03252 [bacterium ADurb.BinA028]|nr:MAG: hypothetical protein BWY91_03252 [bacterium ADurb.BinA028]
MLLVATVGVADLPMVSWWKELAPPLPAVVTVVLAWASLSNSLPSGTRLSGSTLATLV